ncbi:MAG: hypothetical protein HY402_03610, partial [Elusimicrobia bacterium]|nr:hypothetical protein [Elusimicrobiota bacterium]
EVPGPVRNNWIKNAHLAARVALVPFTGEGGLGVDLLGRYRRTLTGDPALKAQTFEGGIVLIF